MNKAQQTETYYLNRLIKLRNVFQAARKVDKNVYTINTGIKRIFNISTWADSEKDQIISFEFEWKHESVPECGTSCCVAGAAGFIPEFRKAGLKTVINNGGALSEVVYGDFTGEDAFAVFFGIERYESEWITMPDMYQKEYGTDDPTPKMVVARLDKLIQYKKEHIKSLGK